MNAAAHLARQLVSAGVVIVSGLARGIDAASHQAALEAGGKTIAVLGTGIDLVYPRSHVRLAREIAERGLLLTEFPPGTPPLAANFPIRNRVISGITLGTVIVEATSRSGSLITARTAAEQGREVVTVPGSIFAPGFEASIDTATVSAAVRSVTGLPWRSRTMASTVTRSMPERNT